MAETKYNLVRLKKLLAMLKENRYPNYPRFLAEMRKMDPAGACRFSARTLQRDVAFLKSEYHAPIAYDHERRGYYLLIPDWSIDIPFLQGNEMRAALLGARLAENIMPPPVRQEVRDAVDTLLSVNDRGMDEKTTLLSLVAMGSRVAVKTVIFRTVFDAWQSHRCLEIDYESVIGKKSRFLWEPHVLAFYEGNWYIKGCARAENARGIPESERILRVLALHRIISALKTEKRFTPDPAVIEAANRRELFMFPVVTGVRMRLSPEAFKFIGEQFEVSEVQHEGAFHTVTIASAPEYRIVNYILAEAGEAKLLNCPELQREVIRRAERCIAVQKEK